jgi:hypothetical protein
MEPTKLATQTAGKVGIPDALHKPPRGAGEVADIGSTRVRFLTAQRLFQEWSDRTATERVSEARRAAGEVTPVRIEE